MITKIDPAHDLTFEEAKPEVEQQWRAEEVDKALAGKADDLVKQLSAGASVAQLAKSAGSRSEVGRRHPPRRANQPAGGGGGRDLPPACRRRGVRGAPDGRMVFKITADRTPPVDFADARVKAIASQLDNSTRESLLDQYVEALRRELGVVVNQGALQSAEGS